jgi:transglutaminase-like putative cysteine protease
MAVDLHPIRKVTATYRGEVHILSGTPTQVTVYLAHPPELPAQTKVKSVVLEPTGAELIHEASPLHRPLWRVVIKPPPGQTVIPLRMQIEATLISRRLVTRNGGTPGLKPLTETEREWYLSESKIINYSDPEFKKWMSAQGLKRKGQVGDLALAQRTFLKLVELYTYKVHPLEPASRLVGQSYLDCDCLSSIFITAMRSNGIPARVLNGFPPKTRQAVAGSLGGHAIAEFYLEGIGWVPCDPSSSVDNDIKKKNPLANFGINAGRLLVFNADGGILFPGSAAPHNSMTGPHMTWRFKGEKPTLKFVGKAVEFQEVVLGK